MKTINVRTHQADSAIQSAGCWPECVEASYERLVAAVTDFANGERNDAITESILNRSAL